MLGPDYIEHFTDAAQGAMDEYTLRLVCIYAALIGSIDFEGDSAYSQAARKAALAAKDVQKAMNEEGRRAARQAAKVQNFIVIGRADQLVDRHTHLFCKISR